MAARDQDLRRPTHELLIYPVTSTNLNQPSDMLYENAIPLNTPALAYFYNNYLQGPSLSNDPAVAPINGNLKGLPPTTIIAAEIDPLVSDGQTYAAKLQEAGNAVVYRLYPGTTHEFFGMGAVVDKARQAEQFGAAQVVASFK